MTPEQVNEIGSALLEIKNTPNSNTFYDYLEQKFEY